MTRRPVAQKPSVSLAPANMIRDDAITALGHAAVQDKAIACLIVYETSDGRVVIRGHDGSRCMARGLLREAASMEGMLDD